LPPHILRVTPVTWARQLLATAMRCGCGEAPRWTAWGGQCELTFGRDGKPMYISGPHDDGEKIIRTLRRGLGDGNYDFVHVIPG
jgi:hypothetical protein